MSASGGDRLPWEQADGPVTGTDVPVTSGPREEQAPGVPRSPRLRERAGEDGHARAGRRQPRWEEREVRAEDPELSPETNAALTEELREVVGADRVRVPAGRAHPSRGEMPRRQSFMDFLGLHRFVFIRTSAIVLTFGAIVALATGTWWFLPLAAGVHALGTMTVTLTIIRMTTETEHPSPQVAAAMAEEGVRSPDDLFSKMVEEFSTEPQRGTGEVLSPGHNQRATPAGADTATAASEESSAMTPTGLPSRPGGEGGTPDFVIWTTAASLFVLSIVLPAVMGGGWLWLLTAVMVPLLAGWVLVERLMITRGGQLQIHSRKPLIAIALCTTIAVAGFCAVVALAFEH